MPKPAIATYSNLDRGTLGQYRLCSISLALTSGQKVTLQFRVTNSKQKPTTFLIDDVSLR